MKVGARVRCSPATPPVDRRPPSSNLFIVDNLHLVKLDEIPELLRWVELQHKSGHLSEEQAGEWFMKIGAWRLWLELNQDDGH